MRIACPHCQAVYEVPQSKLGADTLLRCHLCQYSWTFHDTPPEAPQQPDSEPALPPAPEPEPEPAPPSPAEPLIVPVPSKTPTPDHVVPLSKSTKATPPQPHAKKTGPSGQGASGVLLGGAAVILVLLAVSLLARHGIVKAFPPSAAFFKALGLS